MAVAAVVVVGVVTEAATGWGLPHGENKAQAHSDLPPATAKVTRQTLLDSQSETGSLGHGDTTTLKGALQGTVTALPAADSVVQRGAALYRVDNTPVILLYGTLPAWRALAPGTTGDDVLEFEQNLWALGYRGFTVDNTYSASTATAVKKWQGDLGLTKTGTVETGRIVYASGPVRIDALDAARGDAAGPGQSILAYTGTARVVAVELSVSDGRLAVIGNAVTVTLPDGTVTSGKIATVKTIVQPAEGNSPATTKFDLTVAFDDQTKINGLDQASVDVGFTAAKRENVLTVPVAALLALAEGGYGVQVVDGSTTRIVAVQTGMFASGRVEITGDGIAVGTVVGMPS
jgi:peptidoglycan hydrolase-like protein with peptidoglycan-binding domain